MLIIKFIDLYWNKKKGVYGNEEADKLATGAVERWWLKLLFIRVFYYNKPNKHFWIK